MLTISPQAVAGAAERLRPWIHRTPTLTSRALDERVGAETHLKCENFQRVGAFKFRGAMNAVLQLSDEERQRGVITHSSGNHAQALALAGRMREVPVCVVMPRTAPAVKRAATEGYGARIVTCEPTQESRESTVAELIEREGYALVHPYDDWRVIAGQGTATWELLEQAGPQPLDLIFAPCGGGGLLSGAALAAAAKSPTTRVIGVEPRNADDAQRSLELGSIQPSVNPQTIADGLRTSLGERSFAVLRGYGVSILSVTEAEILETMRFVWERVKIVIEPSSAVALAPLLCGGFDAKGLRVGVILSGGNVDIAPLIDAFAAKIH